MVANANIGFGFTKSGLRYASSKGGERHRGIQLNSVRCTGATAEPINYPKQRPPESEAAEADRVAPSCVIGSGKLTSATGTLTAPHRQPRMRLLASSVQILMQVMELTP
jgi:hypothetical protein